MSDKNITLGKAIKSFRKERGLTQEELAKEIDLSRPYLSDIENDRKSLSVATAENILIGLGVKVSFADYLRTYLPEESK